MRRKALTGMLLICAAILFLGAFVSTASASTLHVPDDYSTIHEAIDAATTGDTIIVRDGTHVGNIRVDKSLTIQSEHGAEKTLIYPRELGNDTVFITADYVKIHGFEIEGRIRLGGCERPEIYFYAEGMGEPIYTANHCEISENILSENIRLEEATYNNISNNKCDSINIGGRDIGGGYNIIANNTINCSEKRDNAIYIGWGSSNNTITNNVIKGHYFPAHINSPNNTITNNKIEGLNGIGLSASDNTIYFNNIKSSKDCIKGDGEHNLIYLNNFIGNQTGLGIWWIDPMPKDRNIWNSPEKITYTYKGKKYTNYMGNYWSNYSTSKHYTRGDGIGDIPYKGDYGIGSDNDYYPLIEPFENYFAMPTPTLSPVPTGTPVLTPTPSIEEDPFNYQGEYELDEAKLRDEEKAVLPYVMKYAKEYKVSPCLIMAVIRQESDFFDYSQDPDKDRDKFDIGYMQVSHIAAIDTYKEYTGDEYKGTEEEWQKDGLDPDQNIKYGTRYLRIQYNRIEDHAAHYEDVYENLLESTVSAYNAGHPTKDNEKYVEGVIQGRDLIVGQRRGYEFFLAIRVPVGGTPMPTPTAKPPGFELIFAVIAIAVVVLLAKRRH